MSNLWLSFTNLLAIKLSIGYFWCNHNRQHNCHLLEVVLAVLVVLAVVGCVQLFAV